MDDKMRKKIVYGAFALAIVWGIYNFAGGGKEVEPTATDTYGMVDHTAQIVTAPTGQFYVTAADLERTPGWSSDPFRPRVIFDRVELDTSYSPGFELTGILYSDTRPMAVINQRPVTVGDSVRDARVVEITRSTVVLEQGGTRLTVKVNKG